jgi:hypothetical protein
VAFRDAVERTGSGGIDRRGREAGQRQHLGLTRELREQRAELERGSRFGVSVRADEEDGNALQLPSAGLSKVAAFRPQSTP